MNQPESGGVRTDKPAGAAQRVPGGIGATMVHAMKAGTASSGESHAKTRREVRMFAIPPPPPAS
jgi:hypothetical protein